MFISTFISFSVLAMPMELSITKTAATPEVVSQFDGVTIDIDRSALQEVQENEIVVVSDFPLGNDKEVKLRLQRFEVLAPNAEIVLGSVNIDGVALHRQMPRPELVLLKGAIEGDPSSRVFIAIGEHTTNGLIESDGITYVLAKDKTEGWTTVYNLSNVDPEKMNWVDFNCGVVDTEPIAKDARRQRSNMDRGCQALQIAVDTDWEFTDLFGGNSAASGEYATTLMGAMSTIFSADVGVGVQVSYLRLWNDSSDPWNGSSTLSQLNQFRDYWQSNMSDVPRHLAHLLSGRSLGGGIAWLSAVCTSYGYAVSANMNGSFPLPLADHHSNNWDIVVVTHETGHNTGTGHTHSYNPPIDGCGNGDCSNSYGGTIMSYCHTCSGGMSNIVLNFHAQVQSTIEYYLEHGISCSLDCDVSFVGACCQPDESCTEVTESECVDSGGVFLGVGSLCASGGCSSSILGACCTSDSGSCSETDFSGCGDLGGQFLGAGTTCASDWCDPDTPFACCFGNECQTLSKSDCLEAAGGWLGLGSSCAGGDCADALFNDFCATAFPVTSGQWYISTVGGFSGDVPDDEQCDDTYLGIAHSDIWFSYESCNSNSVTVSTCNLVNFDSDLVVYTGACDELDQVACNGDGDECAGLTSELTFAVSPNTTYFIRLGGYYEGAVGDGYILISGQICNPDVPCIGDVNQDNMIDTTDLLLIIKHYYETTSDGEPISIYDINENQVVGIGDLLMVVANWGICE